MNGGWDDGAIGVGGFAPNLRVVNVATPPLRGKPENDDITVGSSPIMGGGGGVDKRKKRKYLQRRQTNNLWKFLAKRFFCSCYDVWGFLST